MRDNDMPATKAVVRRLLQKGVPVETIREGMRVAVRQAARDIVRRALEETKP